MDGVNGKQIMESIVGLVGLKVPLDQICFTVANTDGTMSTIKEIRNFVHQDRHGLYAEVTLVADEIVGTHWVN